MRAIWVEIPVKDIERAKQFYQAAFSLEPKETAEDDVRRTCVLINTSDAGLPGTSLNQTKDFEPSNKGVLVYIDAGEDLTPQLDRIKAAGGTIDLPKTSMGGDTGNYALFTDTEGNRLALYSYK